MIATGFSVYCLLYRLAVMIMLHIFSPNGKFWQDFPIFRRSDAVVILLPGFVSAPPAAIRRITDSVAAICALFDPAYAAEFSS